MKKILIALVACLLPVVADASGSLNEKVWNHGSENCGSNRDPAIEIFRFDAATYVLRQNKCVHFEAPFIYVLFGEHTVFIQDTGATDDPAEFPLYDVVHGLIAERNMEQQSGRELKILVTHSHSHSDHTAADAQFLGKPDVTLVAPDAESLREHFGFTAWPEGMATIDLGGRELVVLPIPGHQEESIAVYDSRTGWLLTGDTLYPGQLYVKNWVVYKSSVRRLVEFSETHPISAVLGTHIEMSGTGQIFPRGNTYQPGEAHLPLTVDDLTLLHESLRQAGDEPRKIITDKFVVTPISAFQRILGSILKGLGFL